MTSPPSTDVRERWEYPRDTVYNIVMSTFSKGQVKSAQWLKAYSEKMLPLIEERSYALAMYKSSPRVKNLQALRTVRSKVQQTARRCANDYWLQLCSKIQVSAAKGNIKGMHDGIKQAIGSIQNKKAL